MAKIPVYLGSISHATLRSQDLFPAFLDEATRRFPDDPDVVRANNVLSVINDIDDDDTTEAFWNSEWVSYVINEDFFDILNRELPPYWTFGSTEGDGADFGYWVDYMSIEDAIEYGTIHVIDSLFEELSEETVNEIKGDGGIEYVLLKINDTICELYDLDGNTIWRV